MNTDQRLAYSRLETTFEFSTRIAAADKAARMVHLGTGLDGMDRDALDAYAWSQHKMQRRIVWVES